MEKKLNTIKWPKTKNWKSNGSKKTCEKQLIK